MNKIFLFVLVCFTTLNNCALAAVTEYKIVLKNHLFYPSTITVPANQKVKLIIVNQDQVAEEFDSFSLNREKVIFAGRSATIFIGPLKAGVYDFFGEYHPSTAQGKVVVLNKNQENPNVN